LLRLDPKIRALLAGGACLVTATRQRATAVRLAYAAAEVLDGHRVWHSPDVLAYGAWLEREWSSEGGGRQRLLRPAEEWLLWREVALEAARDHSPLFPDSITEGLRRASGLLREYAIPVAALRGLPGSEALLLSRAVEAFERRCAAGGVRAAVDLPTELGAAARAVMPPHRAGDGPRTPRQRQLGFETVPGPAPRARVALAAAPDADQELEMIAEWAERSLARDPTHRLLIVLPDLPGRGAQLARVLHAALAPADGFGAAAAGGTPAFALEGGVPLGRHPAVAHALEGLTFCTEGLEFARLSAWLRAPFWADLPATDRARLDRWLRGRGQVRFAPRSLLETLRLAPAECDLTAAGLQARLRAALEALGGGSGPPRLWAERFRAALEALGWPGRVSPSSAEAQLLARFIELLREFGGMGFASPAQRAREALALLRDLAARVPFEAASGDTPVTVTDSIDDPVVRYDGIWVAGLQAEVWPPPARPDPFIPWSLQRAAGIPEATASAQLARARHALERWRAASDELVLSYAQQIEGITTLASPLLAAPDVQPFEPRRARPSFAARLRSTLPQEEFLDDQGPAWPGGQPLPGGARALELQNQCAFRAFAELRLGAVPLEEPVRGVDPRLRGQLLHHALEQLWRELGDSQGLAALGEATLAATIERCVRAAARELLESAGGDFDPRLVEREIERSVRLLGALCALERSRPAFTVESVELRRRVALPGAALELRLDRVDRLADGSRVILDYKSGRAVPQRWLEEPLSHPQLLAYLLAVEGEVSALATVHVGRAGVEFRGIALAGGLLPKVGVGGRGAAAPSADAWARQLATWRAIARRLASEFVAGDARVEPIAGACKHCPLPALCRISERPEQAERGAEDEAEGEARDD
jgi:probable DNA repair protein